jgi:hypothetical protein
MLKKQNKTYKNSSERLTADCKRYPESGLVLWRFSEAEPAGIKDRFQFEIRPIRGPQIAETTPTMHLAISGLSLHTPSV